MGEGPSLNILSRQPAEQKPDFRLNLCRDVSNYSSCGVTWKTITIIQQEEILVAGLINKIVGDKKTMKKEEAVTNICQIIQKNHVGRYCTLRYLPLVHFNMPY